MLGYNLFMLCISTDFKWYNFSLTVINVLYDKNNIKVTIVIPTGNSNLYKNLNIIFHLTNVHVS